MTAPAHARSTALDARLWGPDIARGLALLGIVVSNMYYYLYGQGRTIMMKPVNAEGIDRWVDSLTILFFDNRGFTLFSILFGYGIAMLHARAMKRGDTPGRFYVAMMKRHALLLAIGLVHAIVLFGGDIIVTYAVLGFVVSALVLAPRWVQMLAAVLVTPALMALGAFDAFPVSQSELAWGSADITGTLGEAFASRLFTLLFLLISAPFTSIGILVPMLIGVWLHHWGLFEKARERIGVLCAIASGGLVVSLLGATPALLIYVDAVSDSPSWITFTSAALHQLTGLAGAISYVATAAIVGAWKPAVLFPLAALGTMSMSGYLFQSVVSVIVYPAYAVGAGVWIGSAHAALISVATWLFTLGIATVLRTLGTRGPVEWLFRRVLYGRPTRQAGPPNLTSSAPADTVTTEH